MTPGDQCEYCAEAIRWLTTAASGKAMPVNAQPDPRGNVLIVGGLAAVLGPGPARGAAAEGKTLYMHHVVTCPYKHLWQRKTKPAPRAPRPAPALFPNQ